MTNTVKPMVFFIDDDPLSNKFNTMLWHALSHRLQSSLVV